MEGHNAFMSLHLLTLYVCTQQPIIAREVAGSVAAVAVVEMGATAVLKAAVPVDIAEDIAAVAGHTVTAAHTVGEAHIALGPAAVGTAVAAAIVGAAPKAIAAMVGMFALKILPVLSSLPLHRQLGLQ